MEGNYKESIKVCHVKYMWHDLPVINYINKAVPRSQLDTPIQRIKKVA